MRAWILLVIAGLLEIIWAIGFKYVKDESPWWLHAGVFAALVLSFVLLVEALKSLPVGTAYAAWTGIGAVGVATVGILAFGESAAPQRILFIVLIVVGIVGLKLTTKA